MSAYPIADVADLEKPVSQVAPTFNTARVFEKKNEVLVVNSVEKTVYEECFTDVLFFSGLAIFGLCVHGDPPWLSICVHIASSLISGIILIASPWDRISRERMTIAVSMFSMVSALVDALFIAQVVCRAFEDDAREPTFFAKGVAANAPLTLTVLISAHATALIASIYRACRVSVDLDVDFHFCALGGGIATAAVYGFWITDFTGTNGSLVNFHLVLTGIMLLGPLVDAIVFFSSPDSHRRVWWFLVSILVLQYIVFVSNVTVLLGEESFIGAPVLTHHYKGYFARAQAVGLTFILTLGTWFRVTSVTPTRTMCRAQTRGFDVCYKTPAGNSEVEPFAAFLVGCAHAAGSIFPTVCGAVALFGYKTPSLSRFALLVYASLLSIRFWVQSHSVEPWIFILAALFGFLIDAGVIVLFVFVGTVVPNTNVAEKTTLSDVANLVAHIDVIDIIENIELPSNLESVFDIDIEHHIAGAFDDTKTAAITVVALSSALLSVVCLGHSIAQEAKQRQSLVRRKTQKLI